MRNLLLGTIGLGLVALSAGAGTLYWHATTPLDPTGTPVEFVVAPGSGAYHIADPLSRAGLIRAALPWTLFVRQRGGVAVKAGRHQLSAAMDFEALAQALEESPVPPQRPIALVEGWRLIDTDQALTEQGLIEAGDYLRAASSPDTFQIPFPFSSPTLEGYLLPNTYSVEADKPLDLQALIQRQLDAFAERFFKPHQAEIEESPRDLSEIVIVASMLEREEPTPAVRPTIAGIMYKRLDRDIALGIDATSRYLLDDWSDRRKFLKKLRNPNDPYNTRLKKGLPPTPIGAPSENALLAALRPKTSEHLYYLHDADKQVHFAATAAGHEANRKRYNVY